MLKLPCLNPQVSDISIVRPGSRLTPKSTPSGTYAFPVTCLALGEVDVTLYVGNKASETLKNPVVAKSTVKVRRD